MVTPPNKGQKALYDDGTRTRWERRFPIFKFISNVVD